MDGFDCAEIWQNGSRLFIHESWNGTGLQTSQTISITLETSKGFQTQSIHSQPKAVFLRIGGHKKCLFQMLGIVC